MKSPGWAGVSVRTLRHYHQTGLLPEPPREANGYRSYGMHHLIRLLRIGQLTALGMRLSDIPTILDGDHRKDASILDEIDQSLARQIEVLKSKRQQIAALKEGSGPLDMPPELATSFLSLEAGRSAEANRAGREQSVLFGQVLDDDGRHAIADLYARLAGPDLAAKALDLGQRFDALGPGSSDAEINALAEAYLDQLGPWLREFDDVLRASAREDTDGLLWSHSLSFTNAQQRQLIEAISARLAAMAR